MTPEMYRVIASLERNIISRSSRRDSSVDSTLMASKRFLIVPEDSSAASTPLPGAVMASAPLLRSARFIGASLKGVSLKAKLAGSQAIPKNRSRNLHVKELAAAGRKAGGAPGG